MISLRTLGLLITIMFLNCFLQEDAYAHQWEKTFGGLNDDIGESVQQASDGGFIIVGETYSFGTGSRNVYLIKTNADGNKQWEKTFGGLDSENGFSVKQTTDGAFIITGATNSFGAGQFDVFLIYYHPQKIKSMPCIPLLLLND